MRYTIFMDIVVISALAVCAARAAWLFKEREIIDAGLWLLVSGVYLSALFLGLGVPIPSWVAGPAAFAMFVFMAVFTVFAVFRKADYTKPG